MYLFFSNKDVPHDSWNYQKAPFKRECIRWDSCPLLFEKNNKIHDVELVEQERREN